MPTPAPAAPAESQAELTESRGRLSAPGPERKPKTVVTLQGAQNALEGARRRTDLTPAAHKAASAALEKGDFTAAREALAKGSTERYRKTALEYVDRLEDAATGKSGVERAADRELAGTAPPPTPDRRLPVAEAAASLASPQMAARKALVLVPGPAEALALVEKGLPVREVETAVLGDPWAPAGDRFELKASLCAEILPNAEFYDYKTKYLDPDRASFLIPAPLPAKTAARVRGVYTFDLLTVDIHKEVKTFSLAELSQTILKNAQTLMPGETRLVKYSSVYGLLQKLSHQDWGKMSLKTSMEVFKDKSSYLDLLVKQLIRNFEFAHEPGILLLNDLSQNPLFDPRDALQQERLSQVIEQQIPNTMEFLPEVYVQDRNGVRELLSSRGKWRKVHQQL